MLLDFWHKPHISWALARLTLLLAYFLLLVIQRTAPFRQIVQRQRVDIHMLARKGGPRIIVASVSTNSFRHGQPVRVRVVGQDDIAIFGSRQGARFFGVGKGEVGNAASGCCWAGTLLKDGKPKT